MNWLLVLSKLKHSPKLSGIRKYTNLLYYDPKFVNVDLRNFDIVEVDSCRFHVTDQINAVQRVRDNDWFKGVRITDTVVDIGANIGAMTVPFAKIAYKVIAVEPLFTEELRENIILNDLHNVVIREVAIGRRFGETKIQFAGRECNVVVVPFESIKKLAGGKIDFLKMDGEGCEWDIEPEELKGIRELRIEFHIARDKKQGHEHRRKYMGYLYWMKSEGYDIHETDDGDGFNPYFIGHPEVRASLR